MDRNSSHLAEHLFKILRLNPINQPEDEQSSQRYFDTSIYLTDQEIFDHATLHDLPICLSIDGSLGEDGIATTTVRIVAPDIRETVAIDGGEWQDRIAKVLLIRSWRLPMKWGTSNTSINMAESIGFLLGEYMIPSDYPIIYVTDSNNARSLQCNLTNMHNYTHRYNARHVNKGLIMLLPIISNTSPRDGRAKTNLAYMLCKCMNMLLNCVNYGLHLQLIMMTIISHSLIQMRMKIMIVMRIPALCGMIHPYLYHLLKKSIYMPMPLCLKKIEITLTHP